MIKTFRLEAVVSITTGRLVCEIGEVLQALDHMTGDSLFTHRLPRAVEVCGPWLKIQHRDLHHADHRVFGLVQAMDDCKAQCDRESLCKAWVASLKEDGLSSTYDVEPLPEGVYRHEDPIAELQRMVPDSRRIIVVETN